MAAAADSAVEVADLDSEDSAGVTMVEAAGRVGIGDFCLKKNSKLTFAPFRKQRDYHCYRRRWRCVAFTISTWRNV